VRGLNALPDPHPVGRPGPNGEGPAGPAPAVPPQAPMLAWLTQPGGYLMAIGRPAAQVGLYHPAKQHVVGRRKSPTAAPTKLGWQLFEHQVDWDYFDEQSLSSVAAIADAASRTSAGRVVPPPSWSPPRR